MVNTEKLLMLLQMLNGSKKMRLIAQGAIERLKRFTGTNATALSTTITPYTDDPQGMWLYHLQEWMKHRNIQVKRTSHTHSRQQTSYNGCVH